MSSDVNDGGPPVFQPPQYCDNPACNTLQCNAMNPSNFLSLPAGDLLQWRSLSWGMHLPGGHPHMRQQQMPGQSSMAGVDEDGNTGRPIRAALCLGRLMYSVG